MIMIPKSKNKAGNFQGSIVLNIRNGIFFKTIDVNASKNVTAWKMKSEDKK